MDKEIITRRYCCISEELFQEIKKSQSKLNEVEKNKVSGKRKNKWNFLSTSDKVGKYLKELRKNNAKV